MRIKTKTIENHLQTRFIISKKYTMFNFHIFVQFVDYTQFERNWKWHILIVNIWSYFFLCFIHFFLFFIYRWFRDTSKHISCFENILFYFYLFKLRKSTQNDKYFYINIKISWNENQKRCENFCQINKTIWSRYEKHENWWKNDLDVCIHNEHH